MKLPMFAVFAVTLAFGQQHAVPKLTPKTSTPDCLHEEYRTVYRHGNDGKYYTCGKDSMWHEAIEVEQIFKDFNRPDTPEEQEAHKKFALDAEKKRTDLLWAARTRVLTDAEMQDLKQYDIYIFVPECVGQCYKPPDAELSKELNDLLLQQFKMRALAAKDNAAEAKK